MRRWAACIASNVGITSCRREEKLYTSIKVGHSRTSVLFYSMVWFTLRTVKTTLVDDIYTEIHQATTPPPSFLGLNLRRTKSFTVENFCLVDGFLCTIVSVPSSTVKWNCNIWFSHRKSYVCRRGSFNNIIMTKYCRCWCAERMRLMYRYRCRMLIR